MDTRSLSNEEYISTLALEFTEHYKKIHQQEFEDLIEKMSHRGLLAWLLGQNNPFVQKIKTNLDNKWMLSASRIGADDIETPAAESTPGFFSWISSFWPFSNAAPQTPTEDHKPKLILDEIIGLFSDPSLIWEEEGAPHVELFRELLKPLASYDSGIQISAADLKAIQVRLNSPLENQSLVTVASNRDNETTAPRIATARPIMMNQQLAMVNDQLRRVGEEREVVVRLLQPEKKQDVTFNKPKGKAGRGQTLFAKPTASHKQAQKKEFEKRNKGGGLHRRSGGR